MVVVHDTVFRLSIRSLVDEGGSDSSQLGAVLKIATVNHLVCASGIRRFTCLSGNHPRLGGGVSGAWCRCVTNFGRNSEPIFPSGCALCYGLNHVLPPLARILESQPPGPEKVTLIGNGVMVGEEGFRVGPNLV